LVRTQYLPGSDVKLPSGGQMIVISSMGNEGFQNEFSQSISFNLGMSFNCYRKHEAEGRKLQYWHCSSCMPNFETLDYLAQPSVIKQNLVEHVYNIKTRRWNCLRHDTESGKWKQ